MVLRFLPIGGCSGDQLGQIFNTVQPLAGLASGGPGDPREIQLVGSSFGSQPDPTRPFRVPGYTALTLLILTASLAFLVGTNLSDRRNSIYALLLLASFSVRRLFSCEPLKWSRCHSVRSRGPSAHP